ncbi:MAG: hypothetical protein IPP19_00010 [Verrucomicrobia bacterium]|nr:hypothetical protein [Verrucomicrobiota bacterium]
MLDPNADTDHDGMPDWWELSHYLNPNDPSDASPDLDGDGLSSVDEYNLWRLPGTDESTDYIVKKFHTDLSRAYLDSDVIAKGNGSVTLTYTDENNKVVAERTYNVQPPSGYGDAWWLVNRITGYPATEQLYDLGSTYKVTVTSSGVTDFIIAPKLSPKSSPLLNAAVQLNGSFTDRILKSEIKNGSFSLRIMPVVQMPFATMDSSEFVGTRRITFGMGSSASGQTAGRIMFFAGSLLGDYPWPFLHVMKGPALSWSYQTPTHFQGRVPSGYVEMIQTRECWTVRYFAPGAYPDKLTSFNDFSGATPLATYEIRLVSDGLLPYAQRLTITRSIGGVIMILESEWDVSEVLTSSGGGDPNSPFEDFYTTTATTSCWSWRAPTAPRQCLTKAVATTSRLELIWGSGPVVQQYGLKVCTTQYQGSSDTDLVGLYKEEMYDAGDNLLASKSRETRGVLGEQALGNSQAMDSNYLSGYQLTPGLGWAKDSGGATTITEYYGKNLSAISSSGLPFNNLEGEPMIAIGEVKRVWETYADEQMSVVTPAPDPAALVDGNRTTHIISSAPVTTYNYYAEPVDGRAAVRKTVTTSGSAVLGHTDYTYVSSTFNGQPYVTTTATSFANATSSLTTIRKNYSRRIDSLDLRSKPISIQKPDGTKTSYAYQRGTLTGTTWAASASGPDLLVAELNGKAGTSVTTYRGVTIDSLVMDATRSTVTERILGHDGILKQESTYVYQTGGTFALLNSVTYTYDAFNNLISKVDFRVVSLYEAQCTGFPEGLGKDDQGINTRVSPPDNYGHVKTVKRASAAMEPILSQKPPPLMITTMLVC